MPCFSFGSLSFKAVVVSYCNLVILVKKTHNFPPKLDTSGQEKEQQTPKHKQKPQIERKLQSSLFYLEPHCIVFKPQMDLTLKPFFLCFAALLLLLLSLLSSANPVNSDYNTLVYNQCSNQTFTTPPTQQTLSSLFQELIAHSSQSKFFKHTQATGDDDETGISGLFQCIQDISNEECQSCVSTLPDLSNTLCRESVSARVQLRGCYLHYELDGFDSESSNHKLMHKTCGELSNGLAGGFEEMRDAAFAALESGIVMNGDGFYKTTYEAIQVMAQCVGGLGACECGGCVSSAVQIAEAECGAALSGQIYLEECFLSYTNHPDEIPDHPHPGN